MIIIVMGVAGSGKSAIARKLSDKTGIAFVDADSFHSPENVEKMSKGIPLTDEDRAPWLLALRTAIDGWLAESKSVALACSALKNKYRVILKADAQEVKFVYLQGDYFLFHSRLLHRKNHFMSAEMLAGQFQALEEPQPNEALICDASKTIKVIVENVMTEFGLESKQQKQ